jgi:hypothetical protein
MIEKLCDEAGGRVALITGNGIHRYSNGGQDWQRLIDQLARNNGVDAPESAKHLPLPEFYDLISLGRRTKRDGTEASLLKSQFCQGMETWQPAPQHMAIVDWARRHEAPILTTNFDLVLEAAAEAKEFSLFKPRGSRKRPSDYYPWEKYQGLGKLGRPCDGFGIWHINGYTKHIRSIRLGLSDYMGCVTKCRPWIGKAENFPDWPGRDTWLDIVLQMPFVMFGLALDSQEVWLRWLLIQRAKHYKRQGCQMPKAWYVYPSNERGSAQDAKNFFLKSVGIKPLQVDDYDAIYRPSLWR